METLLQSIERPLFRLVTVMMEPIRAFGVAHGRNPSVSGQRMNDAMPLMTVPLGGAGTLTVMISGAGLESSGGRNAGSAGPGSTVVGAAEVGATSSSPPFEPPETRRAGIATIVIAAATKKRRRSV